MKKFTRYFAAWTLIVSISLVSCRKNTINEQPNIDSMTELQVSPSFNWATTQDVEMEVRISDAGFLPLISKLSVYAADPASGAELIASGSISPSQPYSAKIKLASYIRELYIKLETTTGNNRTEKVAIQNGKINFAFVESQKSGFSTTGLKSVPDPGPDCDNCDVVISGNSNVTITGGKTYCVTDTYTGRITFETWNGGGTLKVCGTATLTGSTTLGTDSHIIVTQNGNLTINSLSMWGNNPSLTVYANASLTVNSGLTTSGYFDNHGTVVIDGSFVLQQLSAESVNNGTITLLKNSFQVNNETFTNNGSIVVPTYIHLNTGSTLTNNGEITAGNKMEVNGSNFYNNGSMTITTGYFNMNSGSKIINEGTIATLDGSINFNSGILAENHHVMHASNDINLNSATNVTNYCQMIADDQVELNSGQFHMYNGYLKANTKITLNGSSSLNLHDGCLVTTDLLLLNASIYGTDDLSSVIATTKIHINSSNVISGSVEAASNQLYISQNTPASQHIINGATFVAPENIQNFLPITGCNPDGVGSGGITDTDNDGVPDDLDAFPTDPERAFRSWYPGENTFATLAYEDLWPGLGDFDFNDAVIVFQYEMITNAQNELKEMNAKFRLMAAGASLNNGFAVSMPFAPQRVASLTGTTLDGSAVQLAANGVEDGHANETVVVVFDAIGTAYGEFINTLKDRPYVETDTISLQMILGTPASSFGAAPFNPFLFVDQERGKEVHLIDMKPTELVDPSYFGTWEDASNPADQSYYHTSGRLPWAIEIPVSFDYPVETVDILLTHLKFASWATSSGQQYQDWYLDKPGYRNADNIYQRPE